MGKLNSVASLALALASPLAAQPAAPTPDYSQDSSWLCLPGRDDICSKPLPTTALNPNGYGAVGEAGPAKNPPVDRFYVYPTVSRAPGLNSDLQPGLEETTPAAVQLAR